MTILILGKSKQSLQKQEDRLSCTEKVPEFYRSISTNSYFSAFSGTFF